MKYLITGITGFAGPHLLNLLQSEGHEVYGLIRCSNGRETDILDIVPSYNFQSVNFIYGDLRDTKRMMDILTEYKFDGVFHLAAQSHPPTSFVDPIGTFQDNIMGSANLINAISEKQPDCKIMFCSTSEVYGNIGKDGRKIKENDVILPANPYGVSKAATDLFMQERMINKKIHGFITRAFSHTGPRRGKNFSISSDAYQIAKIMGMHKRHPVYTMNTIKVGNLDTTRVVIDVRDTVRAYYLLMQNPKSDGKIFNVCGDTPRVMRFFTDQLIKFSDIPQMQTMVDPKFYRPIDIYYQHGDTTALKELTGWKPKIPIEQTLKDLLNYWEHKIWEN